MYEGFFIVGGGGGGGWAKEGICFPPLPSLGILIYKNDEVINKCGYSTIISLNNNPSWLSVPNLYNLVEIII